MNQHQLITPILDLCDNPFALQSYLGSSKGFDSHILGYENKAKKIWRSVMRRYANKESEYAVPYHLAESVKLYAVDSLAVTAPLIKNQQDLFKLSEFFVIFYLIVHYFDDHVEHRDKFYSKFDFSTTEDIDTQRGAAPFSFVFVSFALLHDILTEIKSLNSTARDMIMKDLAAVLARQSRYFASERQNNLDIMETLEMKQRQVSGATMAFFGELVGAYLSFEAEALGSFVQGLVLLGSLTQITDDIRDQSIDKILHNANIVVNAHQLLGVAAGNLKLAAIYSEEAINMQKLLTAFYKTDELSVICSLPFYPFMVNKQALERR